MTVKQQLREVLENLPDDATLEEVMERIYLLYKIEQGIADADAGRVTPHEEVERRMRAKWSRK